MGFNSGFKGLNTGTETWTVGQTTLSTLRLYYAHVK